ncbi:hypothetical protein RN001_007832 [Aquatica leii]|uniref:Regulatory protein zeste n=1 Tax=Aquatica leii TaxID=1421715 RepID=A0AAN7PCE3_9COLE|nr:hypothetical protein RN001_007832 [Aquatica leii]
MDHNKIKTKKHVKRTVYTDEDAHKLVDIVAKYQNVVESKKTDVVAWKEKDAAWQKIGEEYNCGQLETRTVDQLRSKFDNLKKETRCYFAKQRQDLYRTGGGVVEDNIRAILKLLYNKIRCIINLSVLGLEAFPGDSDMIATDIATDHIVSDIGTTETASAAEMVEIPPAAAECSSKTVKKYK